MSIVGWLCKRDSIVIYLSQLSEALFQSFPWWNCSSWAPDRKKWTKQCRSVTMFEENKNQTKEPNLTFFLIILTLPTYLVIQENYPAKDPCKCDSVKEWVRTSKNTSVFASFRRQRTWDFSSKSPLGCILKIQKLGERWHKAKISFSNSETLVLLGDGGELPLPVWPTGHTL